jgi:hypothetical protein
MSKNIEVPTSLFNRLAKHASGFDTPANVITKILDVYEQSLPIRNNNQDIVMDAFQEVFDIEPRPFGQKTSEFTGFSDSNQGVQWNITVNRNTGQISLGVNLEGVKYDNWPITNLLLKERDQCRLVDLINIEGAKSININMTRDAWQAAARPEIAERFITPENLQLSELTHSQWKNIIEQSLACLGEKSDYRKRGTQVVYLTKSKVKKEMPTSPHLNFNIQIFDHNPANLSLLIEAVKRAKNLLMPLYVFTRDQSE